MKSNNNSNIRDIYFDEDLEKIIMFPNLRSFLINFEEDILCNDILGKKIKKI